MSPATGVKLRRPHSAAVAHRNRAVGVGWTCRGHRPIALAPAYLAEAAADHEVTGIDAGNEPSGGRSYGVIGLQLGGTWEEAGAGYGLLETR